MKTVFTSDEIVSVWVRQEQQSGRCPSSMSFEGRKFYSYGAVVAEILMHHGETVFLVNSSSYSDTTSKHIGIVRCAIPRGARRFHVPGVWRCSDGAFNDFARILQAWQAEAGRLISDSATVREPKKTRLILEAYQIVILMREFAAFFGLSLEAYPVPLPMTEAAIHTTIRARKAREVQARHDSAERARLLVAMRKNLPARTFTARDAYKAWQNAMRERRTGVNSSPENDF